MDVYTAPDVLIVVLKRFLFDTHMGGSSAVYRQKLDTHVSFPVEGLDLTRYACLGLLLFAVVARSALF